MVELPQLDRRFLLQAGAATFCLMVPHAVPGSSLRPIPALVMLSWSEGEADPVDRGRLIAAISAALVGSEVDAASLWVLAGK